MSPSVSVHFLQTQSDVRLLALARRGHGRAFEALVRRYRKQLLDHCRRLLLPEGRAEDALQQALLQAWMALERGDEVRDVRSWLFRIAHNASLNALQRSRYDYAELSDSLIGAHAPEADLDRRIAVREALAGLAALPPQQRDALLRTAVDGHSHEQVAAAMGLSEGAVRGLVYRARATLRAAASALTPPPLVAWAASAGEHGVPLAQRLTEASAAGGGAGVMAVIFKGGAVAVTAGALAVGVSAVHPRLLSASHASAAGRASAPGPRPAAAAAAGAGAADDSGVHAGGRAESSHRPAGLERDRPGRRGSSVSDGSGDRGRGGSRQSSEDASRRSGGDSGSLGDSRRGVSGGDSGSGTVASSNGSSPSGAPDTGGDTGGGSGGGTAVTVPGPTVRSGDGISSDGGRSGGDASVPATTLMPGTTTTGTTTTEH